MILVFLINLNDNPPVFSQDHYDANITEVRVLNIPNIHYFCLFLLIGWLQKHNSLIKNRMLFVWILQAMLTSRFIWIIFADKLCGQQYVDAKTY